RSQRPDRHTRRAKGRKLSTWRAQRGEWFSVVRCAGRCSRPQRRIRHVQQRRRPVSEARPRQGQPEAWRRRLGSAMTKPTVQSKPGPARFDSDGNQLRTGHKIGSAAHRLPESTERVEELNKHIAEQGALDESAKDLTAQFKEHEAAIIGGSERPIEEGRNTI